MSFVSNSRSIIPDWIALVLCLLAFNARGILAYRGLAEAPMTGPESEYQWSCEGYNSATNSSLFAYLWCSSTELAEEAYSTDFVQGIKTGLLFPPYYARYDLQDSWLLTQAISTYSTVCVTHECDDELEQFFANLVEAYKVTPDSIPGKYNVEVSAVTPNAAATAYDAFEMQTSQKLDPQYSVIVVIPYVYAISIIAQRLRNEGAVMDTNAFSFWIEMNENLLPVTLEAIELLDSGRYEFNWEKALEILQLAMGYEADLFASATE